MPSINQPAIVLCLSGHDPSGGAGIQADIEAVNAHGCHAATVVTCLTVQDTKNVRELAPVSSELFIRQARLICQDYNIAAVKIGLLGSADIGRAVVTLLEEFRQQGIAIPVVLDPVLSAGGGAELARQNLIAEINHLLPYISVLTPNRQELRKLTGTDNIPSAAGRLLETGCQAILVTGADESGNLPVVNELYQTEQKQQWRYPKLAGQYHGSGCTLAASIAARLALREPLQQALETAQDYTLQTLRNASNPGQGQSIPNRNIPCTR